MTQIGLIVLMIFLIGRGVARHDHLPWNWNADTCTDLRWPQVLRHADERRSMLILFLFAVAANLARDTALQTERIRQIRSISDICVPFHPEAGRHFALETTHD